MALVSKQKIDRDAERERVKTAEFIPSLSGRVLDLRSKNAEEYLNICRDGNCRPAIKQLRKSHHFLKWAVKLLVPDFFIGHPNLWDNLKTLRKHPQFKPLRMALAAWLIFSLTIGSMGVYTLKSSPRVSAATGFNIKTGYYMGNGTARSVTGLGFQPQLVIIKSDTAAGPLIWKSSAMASAVSTYLGVATADNTENIITLDSDGFTVSADLTVNTSNTRYIFIAYYDSDNCLSTGTMCVGSYAGSGASTREVSTGFRPDLVWVKRATAVVGNFRTSAMPSPNYAAFFHNVPNDLTANYFTTLNSTSFTVGITNNTNSSLFYFAAFKNVSNQVYVGTFSGDGNDDRNITDPGFEPDFVFVKQNSANTGVFSITETWGDYSSLTTASANAVNNIQDLIAAGFLVGNSANVNANTVASYYFAFGGAPDPTSSGSFLMQAGNYTGDGVSGKSISLSFNPDLVIIKANAALLGVWSTSLDTNLTHYFASATAGFTNGITSMGSNSFTLGTDNTVNQNLTVYQYVAFGNATSPHKGAGASDFFIGKYIGNAIAGKAIDHLGIAPSMVVSGRDTGAFAPLWRSSSMSDNTGAYFLAQVNSTDASTFRTLNSDGFSLGAGTGVNVAAINNTFFAFKQGATTFSVGSYAGTSGAQTIPPPSGGIGFSPDYVWSKRDVATAVGAVHRSSDPNISGTNSQYFLATANAANMITALGADSFSVGTANDANTAGGTYYYAAWNSTTSTSPPATPTNSSPSNGATAQDLNTALTGSDYSDPDSHIVTQWQVDDNSDFSSPVWTRTSGAAEITTSITSVNGTFANELSGKTELDHASTYYWRVRYSDGVYSTWSTGTSFTTNIIAIPTHSSPADGGTVTTLTPTLVTSAFSDSQTGHSSANAQWQVNNTNSFSAPLYDSGAVSYASSHAVPSATLADQSSYYWRVRYQDSNGFWSSYSTATRFLVSKSEVVVTSLFGSTVVDRGDSVNIDAQVKLTDGTLVNDAATTINIYDPSGTKIVDVGNMNYLSGSSGVYRYSYTVPSTSGSYLYEVTAATSTFTGYGAANFEVRTIQSDVSNIASNLATHEAAQAAERASQAAERASQAAERAAQTAERTAQTTERASSTVERTAQEAERTAQADSRSNVNDIQTKVTNIQSNLDILIGAMVVTQSTVNDTSASATSFITTLTNATNDFYKNAVLTFTSGNLNGQVRRISGYNGTSKTITLDPALTSAPANSDAFTIVKQNVYVEQQVAEHETAQASFRSDTTARLTSIESKIDTLTTTLNTVDTNLDEVRTTVNSIRASQQKGYKVELSDVSEIQAGNTYRAKLTILDFESNPVDANSTPTILIYDATRAVAQATTTMTKLSTGVYEYTSSISSSATAGLWETIVNVDVAGTADIIRNDYWQVTGAPAQVVINSMTDLTVPSIAANVTITNEGGGAFEYQYEWCVVSSQENQCGGDDDVYYASAAKLISAGDSFNPTLTATIPTVGDYWFKVVVYYGTAASGASRTFTAVAEGVTPTTPTTGGGGGGGGVTLATQENIYSEITKARQDLALNAQKLAGALEILGMMNPNLQTLLGVSVQNTENLTDVQNKVADLRAVSAATRQIIEGRSVEPVVETYMKFNSVEIHFLITNPTDTKQTTKFKAFLPQEARPEYVLNASGLKIDYDTNAQMYYVSGDIVLGPKETVTRKVEMKDVWIFAPEKIKSIKEQAGSLVTTLTKTQYEAQGVILKNDIDSTLNIVSLRQEESYSSPQDHIIVYRENKERVAHAENNLAKLQDLVVQAGASRGVVGQVGGIQTFATWGIILAIVFGFGLLAAVIFAMWRHQTMLAAAAMGMSREEMVTHFGGVRNRRRKVLKRNGAAETATPEVFAAFVWHLPWKKILIWVLVIGLAIILGIAAIKFVPTFFRSQEVWFKNKEVPTSVPQEKSIGSKLVPGTQENVKVFFSNGENNENMPENAKPSIQKLKITDTPTGWLNVRDESSLDGKTIGKVYPSDEYVYTDEKDGWYKIILKDKTEGWVFGSYIEKVKN